MLKPVEQMSVDDLLSEHDSLGHYFTCCREEGQGINSKESIRYRMILSRLAELGETVEDWFAQ